MRVICIFIGITLVSRVATAAPKFSFETTSFVPAGSVAPIEHAFQAAMGDVKALPPVRNNPFRSRIHRTVVVLITTSRDPFAAEQVAAHNSDAFTGTLEGNGELVTVVCLLADRLFWDPETGKQRPDAYVRLVNALAHEIYGNVWTQLSLRFGYPPVTTEQERAEEEVFAFNAGIEFLRRYQKSPLSKAVPGSQIAAAIKRDEETLKTWSHSSCVEEISGKPKPKREKH